MTNNIISGIFTMLLIIFGARIAEIIIPQTENRKGIKLYLIRIGIIAPSIALIAMAGYWLLTQLNS